MEHGRREEAPKTPPRREPKPKRARRRGKNRQAVLVRPDDAGADRRVHVGHDGLDFYEVRGDHADSGAPGERRPITP